METRQKTLTRCVPTSKVSWDHWNRHRSVDNLWLPISDPKKPWANLVSVIKKRWWQYSPSLCI